MKCSPNFNQAFGNDTHQRQQCLTDQIVEHMVNQRMCGTVFFDLKKAFDVVDHKCLLHKLEHYGVRGNALTWFEDYITTRTQKVNYDGKLSSRGGMWSSSGIHTWTPMFYSLHKLFTRVCNRL